MVELFVADTSFAGQAAINVRRVLLQHLYGRIARLASLTAHGTPQLTDGQSMVCQVDTRSPGRALLYRCLVESE